MRSGWQAGVGAGGSDSLALAVAVAISLHAAVIGLVHFDVFGDRPDSVPASLDVILVEWATEEAPDEADFLAQVTQRGGGESPDLKRPAEPMPAGEAVPELEPEPAKEVAETPDALISPADLIALDNVLDELPVAPVSEEARIDRTDSRQLIEQSLAVARAAPDRFADAQDFPERPRKKIVSANTREYGYAAYVRNWVAKVERVGNYNYPEQVRRMNIQGNLELSVDVLADGSVEQIRVLRSSGYDILDEAAIRIVRLSSPFSPFPPEIADEVDVLTINRVWQFTSRGAGLR
jgi:protein TonB